MRTLDCRSTHLSQDVRNVPPQGEGCCWSYERRMAVDFRTILGLRRAALAGARTLMTTPSPVACVFSATLRSCMGQQHKSKHTRAGLPSGHTTVQQSLETGYCKGGWVKHAVHAEPEQAPCARSRRASGPLGRGPRRGRRCAPACAGSSPAHACQIRLVTTGSILKHARGLP